MQAEAFSEYVGSCDYRYIRVQLQYRSRYPWRDRSGQRLPENFPFSLSGQQEDFFRLQNRSNSHGNRLFRYLSGIGKKSGICPDRFLRKLHQMCLRDKLFRWLVKTNMPIMSNAQQPQVDGAVFGNDSLISLALARQVFCTAVRKPGSAKIHSVEQVLLHKTMVALLMESIQSTIFVQINGSGLGKIQIAEAYHRARYR